MKQLDMQGNGCHKDARHPRGWGDGVDMHVCKWFTGVKNTTYGTRCKDERREKAGDERTTSSGRGATRTKRQPRSGVQGQVRPSGSRGLVSGPGRWSHGLQRDAPAELSGPGRQV